MGGFPCEMASYPGFLGTVGGETASVRETFRAFLGLVLGYGLMVGGVYTYLRHSSTGLTRVHVVFPGGEAWIWHGQPRMKTCAPPGAWIQELRQTLSSVDLAMYRLGHPDLIRELRKLAERGVRIRMVTDEGENPAILQKLRRSGIAVRIRSGGGLMHHKFVILDDQQVWLGTSNWTMGGLCRDANVMVAFRDTALARAVRGEMEELWKGEFGPASSPNPPETLKLTSGTSIVVLFSPDAAMPGPLLGWMRQTKRELVVMAASLTDASIARMLLRLHARHVRIRIMAEGQEPTGSRLSMLEASGIPVCLEPTAALLHHKTMIQDSTWVWLGSYNFSRSAAHRNDESVVLIRSPLLARALLQEVRWQWKNAGCLSGKLSKKEDG